MELFLRNFTPVILLAMISLTPIYIMRVVAFIQKKHFYDEKYTTLVGILTHSTLFIAFLTTLIVLTKSLGKYAVYVYIVFVVALVILFFMYRFQHIHTKRHRYKVLYSVFQNRKAFTQYLESEHLLQIDVSEGAFSFVTRIKFDRMEIDEIEAQFRALEAQDNLLHSFQSVKAYLIFILNIAMSTISIAAFVLFFMLLVNM